MDTHDSPSPPPDDLASGEDLPENPPPGTLPRANPLPIRRDGWTIERQARFLKILARTHSVTRAARAVRMSRESAHRLRQRDPCGLFAAMWGQCFAPVVKRRSKTEIDEGHRRAIELASRPLAPCLPPTRATPSTS